MEHPQKRPRLAGAQDELPLQSGSGVWTRTTTAKSTHVSSPVATASPTPELTSNETPTTTTTTKAEISPPQNSEMIKTPDKSTWQGWAEIENDPMIFNIMLRGWGVRGVRVKEVVPLDAVYDSSPASTLGLIFLSRYRPDRQKADLKEEGQKADEEEIKAEIPRALWFANQISIFSCATVALMNIIGNAAERIDLGPQVSRFMASTRDKSSKERGLALDSFEHVRRVHNSFATLIDMKCVDQRLREDAKLYHKKKRKKQQKQKRQQRSAIKNRSDEPFPSPTSKMKRKQRSKTKGSLRSRSYYSSSEDNDDNVDDEQGFHFTAYVPSHGHLWRMDGLERAPESLGILSCSFPSSSFPINSNSNVAVIESTESAGTGNGTGNWLQMATAELSAHMEEAMKTTDNGIEFSVLSLVATNQCAAEEEEKDKDYYHHCSGNGVTMEPDRMMEDWGPALAEMVRIVAERGLTERMETEEGCSVP